MTWNILPRLTEGSTQHFDGLVGNVIHGHEDDFWSAGSLRVNFWTYNLVGKTHEMTRTTGFVFGHVPVPGAIQPSNHYQQDALEIWEYAGAPVPVRILEGSIGDANDYYRVVAYEPFVPVVPEPSGSTIAVVATLVVAFACAMRLRQLRQVFRRPRSGFGIPRRVGRPARRC